MMEVLKIIRIYSNRFMFGIALLLFTWLIFNLEKIDISLKQTVVLTDLLYNKIGLLLIFFLLGVSVMFSVDHFGIKSISNTQKTEYVKWFVSLFLVATNSVLYRSVFTVWRALSQNLMLDNIIDNNIFLVKRLWTHEDILESIASKINLLNECGSNSVKFLNEDYDFVLSNSSGMEEALALSETIYQNRLASLLQPVSGHNSHWFLNLPATVFNFVANNYVEIGIVFCITAVFGFALWSHTKHDSDFFGAAERATAQSANIDNLTAAVRTLNTRLTTSERLTRILDTSATNLDVRLSTLEEVSRTFGGNLALLLTGIVALKATLVANGFMVMDVPPAVTPFPGEGHVLGGDNLTSRLLEDLPNGFEDVENL